MPASFEAKAWNKAYEEGGEDGLQGTEVRAAWGEEKACLRPTPLGRSRCVKKEIARGDEGCREGCWEASRAIGLSPRTLQLAEPWVGGRHAGRGTGASWSTPVWTGQGDNPVWTGQGDNL